MLSRYIALVAIALSCSFHLCADQDQAAPAQSYPRIPTAALDRYQVSVVDEQVETMSLPRLRLTGRKTLQMDLLADHISVPTAGRCSARFLIEHAPDFKVEFFAFPTASLGHPLNDDTLNLYLEGLKLRHKPEQAFAILEPSAFTESGRSKFRILGQRAMTVRYSFKLEDKTVACGENWIERDGTIYMVRILAPARTFDIQFDDVRGAFNSITELK